MSHCILEKTTPSQATLGTPLRCSSITVLKNAGGAVSGEICIPIKYSGK